jgi:hypothetical protein
VQEDGTELCTVRASVLRLSRSPGTVEPNVGKGLPSARVIVFGSVLAVNGTVWRPSKVPTNATPSLLEKEACCTPVNIGP